MISIRIFKMLSMKCQRLTQHLINSSMKASSSSAWNRSVEFSTIL